MIACSFIFSYTCVFAVDAPIEFVNPLNANSEKELLGQIMISLRNVVVVLAILMIVVGGIMYMASFGNEKAMTRAKSVIGAAVIGFAIVLGASTFLREIWNILGANSAIPAPAGDSILNIATRALNLLLSIVGVIGIIGIVVGGITYLTSYGEEKRVETAKKIITASLIGIAICLGAVIIVTQIGNLI